MYSIESGAIYTYIHSLGWSAHQGKTERGQINWTPPPHGITKVVFTNVTCPQHIQVWLLDNYFPTTAFNKCPLEGQDYFLYSWRKLQWRQEAMELWAGGGRAGGAGCSNLSGSNQRGTSVLWVCVTLVVVFGEAQRLISSQAGFCVSYAHLSEIFFYQLLYLNIASWLWGALSKL